MKHCERKFIQSSANEEQHAMKGKKHSADLIANRSKEKKMVLPTEWKNAFDKHGTTNTFFYVNFQIRGHLAKINANIIKFKFKCSHSQIAYSLNSTLLLYKQKNKK